MAGTDFRTTLTLCYYNQSTVYCDILWGVRWTLIQGRKKNSFYNISTQKIYMTPLLLLLYSLRLIWLGQIGQYYAQVLVHS